MTKDKVVIFDGFCNLCNGTVQFIIMRDREKKFSFATFQSDAGQDILKQNGLSPTDQSTVVYVRKGHVFIKSKAVLMILRDLGCCWNFFYILIIIPPIIRDLLYELIAKYRYRLFGKRMSCIVPTMEIMDRFIN